MSGASVCSANLWSTQNNQAGLAFLRHVEAGVCFSNRFLLKELSISGCCMAVPTGAGTFGLVLSRFGYSLYSETKCGLSYAHLFGNRLAAGVQLSFLQTQFGDIYGTERNGLAEAGIQAKVLEKLSIGVLVFNPTRATLSPTAQEQIPALLRIGAVYHFSAQVGLTAEVEKDTRFPALMKLALEYIPTPALSLWASFSGTPAGFSIGVGYQIHQAQIDFSSSWHPLVGLSSGISLSCALGKRKPNPGN
jgi:hypothetical protein